MSEGKPWYKKGEMIGVGKQGEVFDIEEGAFSKGNVVKEEKIKEKHRAYKTKNYTKAEFYFTKILHALFPIEIPDVKLTVQDNDDSARVTVRQKKHLVGVHKKFMDKYLGKGGFAPGEAQNMMLQLADIAEASQLSKRMKDVGVVIDVFPSNFSETEQDDIVYVDSLEPWFPTTSDDVSKLNFNHNALVNRINEQFKDDKHQREKLLRYVEKIEQLFAEDMAAQKGDTDVTDQTDNN